MAFKEEASEYFSEIVVGQVYRIKNVEIKLLRNRQYNKLSHEYEIVLLKNSVVQKIPFGPATEHLPAMNCEFRKISSLESCKEGDWRGIHFEFSEWFFPNGWLIIMVSCTFRFNRRCWSDGRCSAWIVSKERALLLSKDHRVWRFNGNGTVFCFDCRSWTTVTFIRCFLWQTTLTLWGEDAVRDYSNHEILALKMPKVRKYEGWVSLEKSFNTAMLVNPAMDEARQLRVWSMTFLGSKLQKWCLLLKNVF